MIVREAVIALTFRCNARCRLCDIWLREPVREVEPSYYYHLPATLKNINLSGGEPTLREDLPEIVSVISERCPGVRIVVSTNGLATERILNMASRLKKASPKIAFRVSLDGLGKTHDQIRGIPGAYEKALKSLEVLRRGGIRDLGVGFTMIRGNEKEMIPVFELACRNRWQFTSTVVHSSPIFFGDHSDIAPDRAPALEAFGELRRRQMASYIPKNWFRSYFTDGLCDMLDGKPRPIQCRALSEFFYLDPAGMVFPCHIMDEPVGRLDQGYANLIDSHQDALAKVDACRENCWMTCTVAPVMRRSKMKVMKWIINERFAGR